MQTLKFYKKYLEKKFSNLSTEALTFKIIELPTESSSPMEVDTLTAIISKMYADDHDYVVSLGSNNRYESDNWTFGNQLYVFFPFQVNDSLNFLTQSIQPCTDIAIVIEGSIGSSRVNCAYIAFNQNKFVLPNLPITVNLSKCKKVLCFLYKGKKASHSSFYEDK